MGKIGKPQKSKKHKKIKQIVRNAGGPFHRSHDTKINSRPENEEEQEVAYSVKQLMKVKHNRKSLKAKRRKKTQLGPLDLSAESVNVTLERGICRPLRPVPEFKQRKREKEQAFLHRVDRETNDVINRSRFERKYNVHVEDTEEGRIEIKNSEQKKKSKSKLRLKEKNETKKAKKAEKRRERIGDFKQLTDDVIFGEVAMEPPTLTAKPRKAGKLPEQKSGAKALLMKKLLTEEKESDARLSSFSKRTLSKTLKRKHLPLVQQRIMDKERDRAINLYRKMKLQKQNL